jgi:hypothetical protein
MQSPEHRPSETAESLQRALAEVAVVEAEWLLPVPAGLVEKLPGRTATLTKIFPAIDIPISHLQLLPLPLRLVIHVP